MLALLRAVGHRQRLLDVPSWKSHSSIGSAYSVFSLLSFASLIVGRIRGGGRGLAGAGGAWFRHQWINPSARGVERRLRIQADIWAA